MEKDWVLVYSAPKAYQAEILKEIFNENNITSTIINKKDSSYHFGEVEVFVHKDNLEKAKVLVDEFKA